MATVADYIVISDAGITLKPNAQANSAGEQSFTFSLPGGIDLTSKKQRPLLMFKAWTKNGNINAEIDVNATRVRNLPDFQSGDERTIHEIVPLSLLRPGASNDIHFRVVSGAGNAEFTFSDVVLWFQRDGFGPN
jgi:hypothetical protein